MNTLSVKVTEDIYYIGVNDRETHLFENMCSSNRTYRMWENI